MNWTAVSNDDFIVIVSGSSGSGNGEVVYHVAANTGAAIRSGAITVAGLTYNVLQGVDFLDVPASHPAYAEIGKLSAQGIVFGFGGRTFRPDEPTTRSQAAGLLAKALGELEPPPPARQRFADVSPDHPAFVSIDLLAERNILPPEQSEFFHPDEPVTQGQVAALIIRALGELAPPSPLRQRFPDVLPANPYASYIERMAALGITEIKDGDLYRPDAPVTRSQMAALLVRAFNL
ncbi:MAG TPA: S-layer homology domain-containing protein [Blastocatellia bacterium]|nr:S-layer homology domain-containing protein [Blastocatellia bacterium]